MPPHTGQAMNYKRIYEDLIESRKMRPRLDGEYYERHHILPRCMGGGDEEENLIYLTAEEHFMAHMLLAKAYGGKLWIAANAMRIPRNGRKIKHRRLFAIARKMFSDSIRDKTIYKYRHIETGDVFDCMPEEFDKLDGVTKGAGQKLGAGAYKTHKGYCLDKTVLTPTRVSEQARLVAERWAEVQEIRVVAAANKNNKESQSKCISTFSDRLDDYTITNSGASPAPSGGKYPAAVRVRLWGVVIAEVFINCHSPLKYLKSRPTSKHRKSLVYQLEQCGTSQEIIAALLGN